MSTNLGDIEYRTDVEYRTTCDGPDRWGPWRPLPDELAYTSLRFPWRLQFRTAPEWPGPGWYGPVLDECQRLIAISDTPEMRWCQVRTDVPEHWRRLRSTRNPVE